MKSIVIKSLNPFPMKTLLSSLVFCLVLNGPTAYAEGFEEAMKSGIGKLYSCQSAEEFMDAANRFERIALRESGNWLPYYYATFAYIQISFMEQDMPKRDRVLDKAQSLLDSALAISPDESELYVLQALLYPSRILVDPMGRGMSYMNKIYEALARAKALNADNPRIYYLEAVNTLNIPEAMGGGADKARPVFELAETKFNAFTPVSPIHPDWGREPNEAELKKLK
jgi:hypothetical protein